MKFLHLTLLRVLTVLALGAGFLGIVSAIVLVGACHRAPSEDALYADAGTENVLSRRSEVPNAFVSEHFGHPAEPRSFRPKGLFLGGSQTDGGGTAPPNVAGDNLLYFGSGADGNLVVDGGTFTLTRDYYALAVGGTGTLVTAGYKLYVQGTLDINQGLVIANNGTAGQAGMNGGAALAADGGAGGTAPFYGSVPGGLQGTSGGAGSLGISQGSPPATYSSTLPCNGGSTLASGAGGSTSATTGGDAGTASTCQAFPFYTWSPTLTVATLQGGGGGNTPIPYAGIGGTGGGGGAGNSPGFSGGGAGGGGGSAGALWVSAAIINRGVGVSSSGPFQATGGNGGVGGTGYSGTNSGGGGGGGAGGSGGEIVVSYAYLTGAYAGFVFDANGGVGGNGGSCISTTGGAVSGNGGGGGSSGTIFVNNLLTNQQTFYASNTLNGPAAGTAGSGTTGGTGGTNGQNTAGL